ncbi:hypothetical protein N802_09270 [Knoellia sinensis KCTC 19936]|uniref:Uncharacterized protein n=1 Tax=Knoellia sinensis KCTC 19936 TaxID=1385520 RepID=A0A0A0J0S7_9MICO|nr:methyltransferase domain-containing protein [Knoellia sinensis]KGN30324.1 hypothetical protein N802_09270 [Knoellia sinensis KCTC 19936]
MDCCPEPRGYDEVFSTGFSRSMSRRYERRGLSKLAARMVAFLESRGIRDATVLEIGGGIGDLHVELLRRGAASATNLELSANYEAESRALVERFGLADRVQTLAVDIARTPDTVEAADVVVLNRVVCCYRDVSALLTAAGERAESLLVFSHPTYTALNRALQVLENVGRRVRRQEFRGYLHDPVTMVAAVESTGLRQVMQHRGLIWSIVGFERPAAAMGPT